MKRLVVRCAFQVALIGLLVGADARADVAPPESDDCIGKSAGAPCTYGSAGVCTQSTCSKSDYSRWDRDASSAPPATTYDCLKCVTGSGTASNTSTATSTGTQTGTASNTGTTSITATTTDTSTSTDKGGCSLGKTASASRVGAWLMAAAFSLLFLARRRRGQR